MRATSDAQASSADSAHAGGEYDLAVIGAGPAGEKGAAQAAYFGKRVALIERSYVGGAVVNTGTLPSKTLRETAIYLSGLRQRDLYGVNYTFNRDLTIEDLFYRERLVEQSHTDLVNENIRRHHIELIHGSARLCDAHTVAVACSDGSERVLTAAKILLAPGSRPHRPPEIPFDDERIFDTDTILRLPRIPASLAVIGAGIIGAEYATLFAALRVPVTLIDRGSRLLPFLDGEVASALAAQMRAMGVNILFGRSTARVSAADAGASIQLDDGREIAADAVLYSGGRLGNSTGLGLEDLGIAIDKNGRIAVSEDYRTASPDIYAAGDVIGFPALASTSMEQARVAVCHAFGFAYKRQVSSLIPYGLYTIPEVSMVGETEESLRAAGRHFASGRSAYYENARGQIIGDESGFIKLLFDPASREILGVHIIGERASELIHIGQMAMQFHGTIDVFIQNVFNFPTLADGYKYAAYRGLQALEDGPYAVDAPRATLRPTER